MTLDALRGPGAFRCGCGARIKITAEAASTTRCAAPGCRAVATADSAPVRLCAAHDEEHLLRILPRVLTAYPPTKWHAAFKERTARFGPDGHDIPSQIVARAEDFVPTPDVPSGPRLVPPGAVVYFLRVGDEVKIGTAKHLASRMDELNPPPSAMVVLTLPGSYGLEAQLHREFAAERHGGTEWFDLSPRLTEFISMRAPATPLWTRSSGSTSSPGPTRTELLAGIGGDATDTRTAGSDTGGWTSNVRSRRPPRRVG